MSRFIVSYRNDILGYIITFFKLSISTIQVIILSEVKLQEVDPQNTKNI